MTRTVLLLLLPLLVAGGCRQPYGTTAQAPGIGGAANVPGGNMYAGNNQFATNAQATAQMGQLSQQVQSLNSRLSQFNSDNDNLHTQVAALQQRLQNANNYNDQLRQQLADTMARVQQNPPAQQLATSPPPATSPWSNASNSSGVPAQNAGATIHANNGLMQRLQTVQLPGFRSWMDGDVIRIEGPTDRLFVSGTYQLNANDGATLATLANTIRQNFPQQVIGVEAHWDGSPIQPATTSHHQLTATQALAVFDLLVKSGLPNGQVFTMAMGSNRPRYDANATQNGISPNRRIEIVIYPETFR